MIYDQIIVKCRKQKRDAQLAFYRLFAQEVYASSYRILNDACDAEEVMQDVLLKVLSNDVLLVGDQLGMLRRLRRMAINASIDRLRKQRISWVDWDDNVEVEEENTMDEVLWREARFEQMQQAIEQLSAGYRTVLSLHVVEEMSCDEIASMLHIAPSTVRSQLTRAKKRLIDSLYEQRK